MSSVIFGTISAPAGTLNQATQNGTANTLAMYTGTGGLTATGAIQASNFAAGASVSGSNTGDVTIGTADGLSLVGQVLSLALASTSTTGALSSTDWNTFNGKQVALTFANSIQNVSNTVSLVGDAATPGTMMYYGTDGTGTKGFHAVSGLGAGTVTSVALAAPASIFTVSGSPVTTAGTLTLAYANFAANSVLAGPARGASATTPTVRALDTSDINLNIASNATAFNLENAGGTYIHAVTGTTTATLQVPTTSTRVTIINAGTGTVTIAQSATVQVYYGNTASTAGTGGNGILGAQGSSVTLVSNGTSPIWYATDVTGSVSVT